MALILKIGPNDIERSGDGTKVYVKDGTGVYDATTNPGGSGGVNPSRASIALLMYPIGRPTDEDFEPVYFDTVEPITFYVDYSDSYDNTKVSLFTLKYPKDGWYQLHLIALNTAIPDVLTEVYYDTVTEVIKKHNGSAWVAIESMQDVLDSTSLNKLIYDDIHLSYNTIKMDDAWKNYTEARKSKPCKDYKKYWDEYHFREMQAQSANIRLRSGNGYEAQKIIEGLQDLSCEVY